MLNRRGLLKLGTVAGAASLVPIAASQAALGSKNAIGTGANPAHLHGALSGPGTVTGAARTVAPFSVQMPVPHTLRPLFRSEHTDFYVLDTKDGQEEILPGTRTAVTGYGGSYIGPTIRAKSGRRVVIRHRNLTAAPTAVHLHGGHVPANSDGHPLDRGERLAGGATTETAEACRTAGWASGSVRDGAALAGRRECHRGWDVGGSKGPVLRARQLGTARRLCRSCRAVHASFQEPNAAFWARSASRRGGHGQVRPQLSQCPCPVSAVCRVSISCASRHSSRSTITTVCSPVRAAPSHGINLGTQS